MLKTRICSFVSSNLDNLPKKKFGLVFFTVSFGLVYKVCEPQSNQVDNIDNTKGVYPKFSNLKQTNQSIWAVIFII